MNTVTPFDDSPLNTTNIAHRIQVYIFFPLYYVYLLWLLAVDLLDYCGLIV